MKILITTDVYTSNVNGVVTSIKNLTKALTERGHEVRILTLSQRGASYREGNVYYIRSLDAGKVYPGARAAVSPCHRFVKELVEWKPDVVHSQCEFTSYFYARCIAKQAKAPLLHTYHTIYEDYTHYFSPSEKLGKKAVAFLTRHLLKKADGVIAPTDKVARLLYSYGVEVPVYTVPTGIDLTPYEEARREREREGWRRLNSAPILVTVGRVAKEKNLDEILNFLATKRGSRYHWLVVGDGPHRAELETRCRELGLSRRVTFTGMVDPKEVPFYYQMGDAFVSASTSETQGLTYVEALSSGLPAICRKDDCLQGVISNGKNGWQYETAEEFFDALEILFPESLVHRQKITGWEYEMCSINARQSVYRFSTDEFGRSMEAIYRSLRGAKEEVLEKKTVLQWRKGLAALRK